MPEKKAKSKIMELLTSIYSGTENALRGLVSKRMYVIAALVYLAVSELDQVKFASICAVACVYIWSETKKKD